MTVILVPHLWLRPAIVWKQECNFSCSSIRQSCWEWKVPKWLSIQAKLRGQWPIKGGAAEQRHPQNPRLALNTHIRRHQDTARRAISQRNWPLQSPISDASVLIWLESFSDSLSCLVIKIQTCCSQRRRTVQSQPSGLDCSLTGCSRRPSFSQTCFETTALMIQRSDGCSEIVPRLKHSSASFPSLPRKPSSHFHG